MTDKFLTFPHHSFLRLLVSFGAVLSIWAWIIESTLLASDNSNEERLLVASLEHREHLVLQGVRWEWTRERGRCQSMDDALAGDFDEGYPIDRYHCRWLSNKGHYLYESIAQQERRVMDRDDEQRIVLTSIGSEIFLSTENSRILFDPEPFVDWNGTVQNRENGLSRIWGPDAIPVHGGIFGMGRVSSLLDYAADTDSQVAVEHGLTVTNVPAKILKIRRPSGAESWYYFRRAGRVLVQKDAYRTDGDLRSRTVVLERKDVRGNVGNAELPTSAVSYSRTASDEPWITTRIVTSKLKLEPAPHSEMVIPAKDAVLELNPLGHLQTVDFIDEITVDNLDKVVSRLFRKHFEERARLDRHR